MKFEGRKKKRGNEGVIEDFRDEGKTCRNKFFEEFGSDGIWGIGVRVSFGKEKVVIVNFW